MTRTLPAIALLALALSACTAERTPADGAVATPEPAAAAPAVDAGTPATQPVEIAASGDARMDGYGALDFGMTAEEAVADWTDGALERLDPAGDPLACFHMSRAGQAAPSELAFMFEDDMFVRYSVSSDLVAPGGGKRGMTADALQALYGNGLQSTPHKYVEGGQYLGIATPGASSTKLVFALDGDGKATEWRVGVTPQVDYVEGCS